MSSTQTHEPGAMRLRRVAGPELTLPVVTSDRSHILGRAADCALHLPHPAISRHHAEILRHGSGWLLRDLGSRAGTQINGDRVDPDRPVPLAHRDLISIGPCTFEVELVGATTGIVSMLQPSAHPAERIESIADFGTSMARSQLRLLLACVSATRDAVSESDVSERVLDAAIEATGFERAAMIRIIGDGDDVEVLAMHHGQDDEPIVFSRTLVRHAARGVTVMLRTNEDVPVPAKHTLSALGLSVAIAIPVRLGDTVVMFLYVDARNAPPDSNHEDVVFCEALASVASLAVASLRRRDLERRQARLDADLEAAREVQHWMTRAGRGGTPRGMTWACMTEPGAIVAGDLFDAVKLDDDRLVVWLGDVTGEGLAAGLLMAAVQTWLRAGVRGGVDDAALLISALNEHLCEHSAANRFVSLWFGIIDRAAMETTYIDAGHGYWMHRRADGTVEGAPRPRNIVLGVDPEAGYETVVMPISPGERLVLFSDGLVEQGAPDGTDFGLQRVRDIVAASDGAATDVDELRSQVVAFAQHDRLDDDLTIASVGW